MNSAYKTMGEVLVKLDFNVAFTSFVSPSNLNEDVRERNEEMKGEPYNKHRSRSVTRQYGIRERLIC